MSILKKFFFLFFIFAQAECFLTQVETNIFFALVKNTFVKNCLLAPKAISDTTAANIMKHLSENNVFSVFLKREKLRKYLEKADTRVYRWTAIVIKEDSLKLLDYFDNKTLISSYFWLLFDNSNDTLRHELVLKEIPFNTALLLIEKMSNDYYLLKEYYKIKKLDPGVLQLYAEWKNNSLYSSEKDWFDRKCNMNKYEFTTVKYNESLYLTPREKVNEIIWAELSRLLNFTIKPKLVQYSKGYHELDPEEDEALLDTQIYIGRNEEFPHLLGPTSQSGLFMHVKAVGEDKGLSRFLKPLSKYTWLSIGSWICCCGFFCFLVDYTYKRFGCSENRRKNAFENVFAPLYSLCNQSGLEIGENISFRFLIFVIRISAVVIFYAYSATFISYLLLYIPQIPFTDLNGFLEDGTYKIVAERNSEVDTYFNISTQPLERLVYQKYLVDATEWSRLDKEVDKLCKGEKLVLVAYDDDIEKYKPCDIVKIRKPLKVFENGFKIRFRSPFRGLLHIKLLLLRTTGILGKVNSQILRKNVKEINKNEKYEINMEKVSAVFKLFFSGCIFSFTVLMLELIFGKMDCFRRGKKAGYSKKKAEQRTGLKESLIGYNYKLNLKI